VRRAGIAAQDLRADLLFGQAQASGGDPLQLTHLSGVSDPTAIPYCAELGPPGHWSPDDQDSEGWRQPAPPMNTSRRAMWAWHERNSLDGEQKKVCSRRGGSWWLRCPAGQRHELVPCRVLWLPPPAP
jgi:hypothetical protein